MNSSSIEVEIHAPSSQRLFLAIWWTGKALQVAKSLPNQRTRQSSSSISFSLLHHGLEMAPISRGHVTHNSNIYAGHVMNALLKTTPTKCVMATSTSTVCTVLSGEVLEKARRELREEPERREECIAELKRRIEEKEGKIMIIFILSLWVMDTII